MHFIDMVTKAQKSEKQNKTTTVKNKQTKSKNIPKSHTLQGSDPGLELVHG